MTVTFGFMSVEKFLPKQSYPMSLTVHDDSSGYFQWLCDDLQQRFQLLMFGFGPCLLPEKNIIQSERQKKKKKKLSNSLICMITLTHGGICSAKSINHKNKSMGVSSKPDEGVSCYCYIWLILRYIFSAIRSQDFVIVWLLLLTYLYWFCATTFMAFFLGFKLDLSFFLATVLAS